MKRNLEILGLFCLAVDVALFFVNKILFIIATVLILLAAIGGVTLLVLNALYKRTNHWKNQFLFEKNFISGRGYRDDLTRNLDIVNLGSNPAKYGLFYENVRGQNWATGSQGLEMDFEILKYFHSYLKEGGIVLIPIMPFTAISQYIKTKKGYWNDSYYIKFAKILDSSQTIQLPNSSSLVRKIQYPLIFDPLLIRYLFADVPTDNSLDISEQTMSAVELEHDADRWIEGWKKEFDAAAVRDFVIDGKYIPYREESVSILRQIVEYCKERNLKPVLLTIPMSEYLAKKFGADLRQKMVYDFVEELNIDGVMFLDYMFDPRFDDPSLYNGSFFLNLNGRKLFSAQLMKDLGLQN